MEYVGYSGGAVWFGFDEGDVSDLLVGIRILDLVLVPCSLVRR